MKSNLALSIYPSELKQVKVSSINSFNVWLILASVFQDLAWKASHIVENAGRSYMWAFPNVYRYK